MFDLLAYGGAVFRHVCDGKVGFGINHTMRDFARDRRKDLDLVLCRRVADLPNTGMGSFQSMVQAYQIVLSPKEQAVLAGLPAIPLSTVQTTLIALEAKAAFTEFGKARPRLYDELNSSHLTIHGDTDSAIAVGLALINSSTSFVSPLRNPWPIGQMPTVVTPHQQPRSVTDTIETIKRLPRRNGLGVPGFDAVGIVVLNCANDGSLVHLEKCPPSPAAGDAFHWDALVERVETMYATRFAGL